MIDLAKTPEFAIEMARQRGTMNPVAIERKGPQMYERIDARYSPNDGRFHIVLHEYIEGLVGGPRTRTNLTMPRDVALILADMIDAANDHPGDDFQAGHTDWKIDRVCSVCGAQYTAFGDGEQPDDSCRNRPHAMYEPRD